MSYLRGDTYIWKDVNGNLHIWGMKDKDMLNSVWANEMNDFNKLNGVILNPKQKKEFFERIKYKK